MLTKRCDEERGFDATGVEPGQVPRNLSAEQSASDHRLETARICNEVSLHVVRLRKDQVFVELSTFSRFQHSAGTLLSFLLYFGNHDFKVSGILLNCLTNMTSISFRQYFVRSMESYTPYKKDKGSPI